MEQAYRALKKSLDLNNRVKKSNINYYGFKVIWNNFIKDTISINRKLYGKGLQFKKKHFLWIAPDVRWFDELSENKSVPRFNKYGINEIESDDEYFNLSKWSYDDYAKLKFFDRYLFVHSLLDFIVEHGWKPFKYPNEVLIKNYHDVLNENINSHRRANGYRLQKSTFRNTDRPGDLILEHFMPNGYYNLSSTKLIFNFKHKYTIHKWYRAILRILRQNKRFKKDGIRKTIDLDYKNIIKAIKVSNYKQSFFKLCKFRPTCLYRLIIKDLGLSGKTFFDFEPRYGEKFLAAAAEECSYRFRPTCPFDTYYKEISKFIDYDNIGEYNDNDQYDFAIVDFDFKFTRQMFDYYMKNHFKKVDVNIIFVSNPFVESIEQEFKPSRKIPMITSQFPGLNGYLFVYE